MTEADLGRNEDFFTGAPHASVAVRARAERSPLALVAMENSLTEWHIGNLRCESGSIGQRPRPGGMSIVDVQVRASRRRLP